MFYVTVFAVITLLSIATSTPTIGASNITEVDAATMPKANEYRSPDWYVYYLFLFHSSSTPNTSIYLL
jgi:hypothetical protein